MSNAFEAGTRRVIPAVLIYLRREGQTLMLHRNAADRPGDYHAGKWNGLGGKLDADEAPFAAAAREIREECGLTLTENELQLLGILQFPNFKAHKAEDWMVFVFTAALEQRDLTALRTTGPEGDLHWIPDAELLSLNLWEGDRHFLPWVIARRPFMGTLWYEGSRVDRFEMRDLLVATAASASSIITERHS